ncbi:MAG: type II secretion system protein [Betaproteobacteria bacterium]
MRALFVRGHQRGISFLEFAVSMALMGIIVSVLLERALYYQEYAEKTAMESTAENIRTGLRFKVADLILADRVSEIQTLADENPLSWLVDRPPNYLGELDSSPAEEPRGQWYFDTRNRELVYTVDNRRHFSPSTYRDFSVRYRAMRVSAGEVTDSSPSVAGTWVSLVLVSEYGWFQ